MFTTRPVLRGNNWAVSTRKPQATQAAEKILQNGGNAFDAAVAAMGVLAVTDPAMTGIGGDANLLVYSARAKKVLAINASGTAAHAASVAWYQRHSGGRIPVSEGLLCGTVPGVVDACYILLDRWGSMSFTDLFAPAIELADNGFPVSEFLVEQLLIAEEKLRKFPSSARIYFPHGHALRPGDTLRNPDLAKLLKSIAAAEQSAAGMGRSAALRAARDRFYRGDIARALAGFCEENVGLFRYEDFARYEAKVQEPVHINYRGYELYKNASACQGPAELVLLNLLEGYDLRKLGHNSAEYIHVSVEAAKLAYADREKYLADGDFVQIPHAGLLSKEYARDRRRLIDPRTASKELRLGDAELYELPHVKTTAAMSPDFSGQAQHHGDTSYAAIVDGERNAVSFTPSLHSGFGTGLVLGDTGLIFNCRGDCFSLDPRHPNVLMPGKRPRSTLTPSLVMKDGKPFMVAGSPGGDDQILRIAQTFLNVVDFGMNIQEAIDAPRWSTMSFPATEFPQTMYPGVMLVEDRIGGDVQAFLRERGHSVEVGGSWTMGANCAIVIDPETGVLNAGADPRGDSYALAW